MQVTLSSGPYKIVSHGQVFLFGINKDLKINILTEDKFEFSVNLKFVNDSYGERRVNKILEKNVINLTCYNFDDVGTGLTKPMSLAKIDGKELFLTFWSYLEGGENGSVRSVKYTIFMYNNSGDDKDGKLLSDC